MTPADLRALAERVERSEETYNEVAQAIGWRVPGTFEGLLWVNQGSGVHHLHGGLLYDLNAIAAAWEPLRAKGWRWGCTEGEDRFLVSAWRPGRSSIPTAAPTEPAARLSLLLRVLAAEKEIEQ